MSQLTAATLLPLFAALPAAEQAVFVEITTKIINKKPAKSIKRRSVYDKMPDAYRPENQEALIALLINGEKIK
jgi:hypothetical protein